MRYPPPAHAATVWLVGETLHVSFNGGTILRIMTDEKGLGFFLDQLRHASVAPRLSERGNPTQWDYAAVMAKALDEGLRPKIAPRKTAVIDTDNLEDYL